MKPTLNNTVHLTIRKDVVRKDGCSSIILRLKISGRKKDLALGEYCPESFWDPTAEKVKRSYPGSEKINDVIDRKISRARDILFQYKVSHRLLTIDEFNQEFGITNSTSFIEFIASEIQVEKSLLSKASGTISNYMKDLSKLKRYRSALLFSEVTETFLQNYEIYMRSALGNNKNTINRTMRFLRNFNNRARSKGLTELYPFKNYKLSTEKTKPTFLSIDELKLLQQYCCNTKNNKHKRTLIPYLFCCYTGLRHSDIVALKNKNIQEGHIYFRIKKTSEAIRIPLMPAARNLIGEIGDPERPVFRVPCNQTTNRCLKEISKETQINKVLTFHSARHTFATVGLNLGMSISVIRDLLGHSDLKQTQIYAKLIEKTKDDEMKKWDSVFLVPEID